MVKSSPPLPPLNFKLSEFRTFQDSQKNYFITFSEECRHFVFGVHSSKPTFSSGVQTSSSPFFFSRLSLCVAKQKYSKLSKAEGLVQEAAQELQWHQQVTTCRQDASIFCRETPCVQRMHRSSCALEGESSARGRKPTQTKQKHKQTTKPTNNQPGQDATQVGHAEVKQNERGETRGVKLSKTAFQYK